MELTEHPDSIYVQMLQQAQDHVHACIDSDLKWVLKNVHPTLPSYYNPATDCTCTENAKVGPSNITKKNDTTVHHDAKSNVVQLNYQNENDNDTHIGPS